MTTVTNEEFDKIVNEILVQEPSSFDTLYAVATRVLRGRVRSCCRGANKRYEEDLMAEICIELQNDIVTQFLCNQNAVDGVNYDPVGFRKWLFTYANRRICDFFRARKRDKKNKTACNAMIADEADDVKTYHMRQGQIAMLMESFDYVLELDMAIYKKLTWLLTSLLVLGGGFDKKDTSAFIEKTYSQYPLYIMWDTCLTMMQEIYWIRITASQRKTVENELSSLTPRGDITYGESRYEEFFMTKGGRATVSDWVYRINTELKRELGNDTPDNR